MTGLGCSLKQFSLWSCWAFPVGWCSDLCSPQFPRALCGCASGWVYLNLRCNRLFPEFSRWMDCLYNISWKWCWNVVFPSVEMLLLLFQKPLLDVSPLSEKGVLLMQCWWGQEDKWECVNSNLSQISRAGGTKGDKPECGSAGEKGRDSPLSRAITFCTAQLFPKWVAVRVSPPARAALPADLRDLPGEVAVSCFSASSHLSAQTPFSVWCGGTPPDWLCCPFGGGCRHPASSACCLQMNHDLLTMWVVLQGPKNRTDKGCDPVLAQPADRAGVAPHPGEDVQVFHFAELSDRSCSPVTFVVGSLGSPLATRWEVSTSLLKTRGVHGVEL